MSRLIIYSWLCMFLGAVVTACKDDVEPASNLPQSAVYDFVTLEESSADGSVFTMRKSGDSPLISYYSDMDFSRIQTIHDGDRLILCYDRIDGEVYTSGAIDIYGYVQLSSTELKALYGTSADYDGWASPPMKVNSLWRSGCFINLDTEISVFHAIRPESMVIVADKSSLSGEYPVLYIVYENAENNDGDNPYRVYASFDISEIWDRPSCKGVTISYPTAYGFQSMTFEK